MNKKKLICAILSAVFIFIYFSVFLIIFTCTGITEGDVPLPIFIMMIIGLLAPLIGISIALVFRIKELKSGEEEEAKKY